jgi:hypothetical protein
MNLLFSLAILVFLLPPPAGIQEVATITLVEGSLRVIRGANVLQGGEGVRLHQGDIIESSDPGFAQLEFSRGAIIALGPATRVYLVSNAPAMVMLSGWLKCESRSSPGVYRYQAPLLGATTKDGTLLLHAVAGAADMFVESGTANVGEVSPDGTLLHPAPAKAGQFFSRRAGKPATSTSRPDSSFLEAMPPPFRDTLPSRLSRFAGKGIEPRRDHEVSYQEAEPWLNMPRTWRRGFVERFRPRIKDPAFRRALDAHLGEHPEWDPVLHPEKYQPKPPPTPPATKPDSSSPGRNSL